MASPTSTTPHAASRRGPSEVVTPSFCVSVDLDPLRCYHHIHALPPVDPSLVDVILRRALPRFLEVFAQHGLRATFFVVGDDLASESGRQLLRQAATAGHELANHSQSHPYELARLPPHRIEREIGDCHHALQDLTGRPPVGFRGPGYEISAPVLEVLEAFGYAYDSSIFPCPPYYLAKAAILAKMAVLRQESRAILGSPRALPAPTQPYYPDRRQPFRRGDSRLLEIPIAVTPWLRLPAIGTSLLLPSPLVPGALRNLLLLGMRTQPFFNLELHGMDLLGADEDAIPEPLRSRQPDLRAPLPVRTAALHHVLATLRSRRSALTLADFAQQHRR